MDRLIVVSDAAPVAGAGEYQVLGEPRDSGPTGRLYNPDKQCLVGSAATMLACMDTGIVGAADAGGSPSDRRHEPPPFDWDQSLGAQTASGSSSLSRWRLHRVVSRDPLSAVATTDWVSRRHGLYSSPSTM